MKSLTLQLVDYFPFPSFFNANLDVSNISFRPILLHHVTEHFEIAPRGCEMLRGTWFLPPFFLAWRNDTMPQLISSPEERIEASSAFRETQVSQNSIDTITMGFTLSFQVRLFFFFFFLLLSVYSGGYCKQKHWQQMWEKAKADAGRYNGCAQQKTRLDGRTDDVEYWTAIAFAPRRFDADWCAPFRSAFFLSCLWLRFVLFLPESSSKLSAFSSSRALFALGQKKFKINNNNNRWETIEEEDSIFLFLMETGSIWVWCNAASLVLHQFHLIWCHPRLMSTLIQFE